MLIRHLNQIFQKNNQYEKRIFYSLNRVVSLIVDLRKKERKKKRKIEEKEERKDIPSLTHASGMITASIHG